ncbi:YeiH family protein [Nakamurella endophytica]|uniref:Membrane protein n=1 Tax=Nakamurella endophytica TaxID=1748367 RepID=A0A917WCH1_9ACTN|nr:putative sulfate exporter family transporter [Nakamurella endophytica]GGL94277.1 membrane protein [Nakamurella endophytica]
MAARTDPADPRPRPVRRERIPRTAHRCRPDCAPPSPAGAARPAPRWLSVLNPLPGRAAVPGLLVVAVGTAAAAGIAHLVPFLNASTVAVVLGAVLVNTGLHRPVLQAGTHYAGHRLLRIAVVLLGLQLGLPQLVDIGLGGLVVVVVTVAVTFAGTRWIGRMLGLPRARSLLLATGFSICGASAIAAMREVADGDDEDTAVAVALVTVCGSIAIFLLPALRTPLGLDPAAFGSWVGASVHDVGQTVATAHRVPGALTSAVVVKLTRVVLLAPLVTGAALAARRRRPGTAAGTTTARRPPLVPLFVVGFLAAIVLTSTGLLPASAVHAASVAQTVLLTAALFGLGTGIQFRTLARTGTRSLVLALISWVLVAGVSYAGVRLVGG